VKIFLAQAMGLLKSTHPMPSFAVTTFSLMFAVGLALPIGEVVLVGLSVLAQQFSVGLSNDWLDYDRDKRVNRLDKPTARGDVSARLVRNASFAAGLVALALAWSLGWATALMMLLMLAVGWSYNLGLKSNVLSAVPYALGFGILPIFVTLTFEPPRFPIWWVILAAALLGIAAHFANALPDLFDDKETGVRALPHILGQKVSAWAIAATAACASLLVVTQSTTLNSSIAFAGFVLTLGLALSASALALRAKPPRVIFYLLIAASFINVILLMLGQSLAPNS
jgi:4-hydroxybenzoate polyprenyltransferase